MANKEHLAILRKGVKEWNEWRGGTLAERPDLSAADLPGVKLAGANFRLADLRGASLSRAELTGANFRLAELCDVNFKKADLRGADLREANLNRAYLSGASLDGAFLNGATLSGAELEDAELDGANLGGCNLSGTTLRRADLGRVNLNRASLDGTDFSESVMLSTSLGEVDLSTATGLELVHHAGPSTLGIETLYRSKGRIPEEFLRGAGVPEPFIANMKTLVAAMEQIQFYSCFISYSSEDQAFAERLYADLQSKNVRCWFDREDMKIGDRIRPRIDEAIRVHDKLLLVLTENSMKSAWVEKEVETAFEKERKQERTVLFPIRLDDAVMDAEEAWAADIRRTRHIGDFRGWKDHDEYKKAFERLMRDLKAEK